MVFLLIVFPFQNVLVSDTVENFSILSARNVASFGLKEKSGFQPVLSYPSDPTSDIPWSSGVSGVLDIQAAFNYARTRENAQLGLSMPMMILPSQSEWDGMSDAEKALWLINRERVDRNLAPLENVEFNVTDVAQNYANYLFDNNTWGHTADGLSPWQRLNDNPSIGACHDNLSVAENIAAFVTSGSSISLPLERAIYMFLYEDMTCCNWGHRHTILWYPYNDNSGQTGMEGFLGIGRATGGPYQGPFSKPWPHAEIIVMNVFDPCTDWDYSVTTFADVLPSHPYYEYIEALYANGLTNGCNSSPLMYCPDMIMNRAQIAKFFMTVQYGGSYLPPTDTLLLFQDNWSKNPWAEIWANDMYAKGLTSGCNASPLLYCPDMQIPRDQVAKFGLAIKYGNSYTPPPAEGLFADMPDYWATAWAEQAYRDGLVPACGTDAATGKPLFCPTAKVDRGFASFVIVTATGLLGP